MLENDTLWGGTYLYGFFGGSPRVDAPTVEWHEGALYGQGALDA